MKYLRKVRNNVVGPRLNASLSARGQTAGCKTGRTGSQPENLRVDEPKNFRPKIGRPSYLTFYRSVWVISIMLPAMLEFSNTHDHCFPFLAEANANNSSTVVIYYHN